MTNDIPHVTLDLFKHSQAPIFRTDCYFLQSKRCFVPADFLKDCDKKDQKTAVFGLFFIQVSPSKMAKCRICGVSIDKGQYRCGFPVRDSRGEFQTLSAWSHIECCGSLIREALNLRKNIGDSQSELVGSNDGSIPGPNTANYEEIEFEQSVPSLFIQWNQVPQDVQETLLDCARRSNDLNHVEQAKMILEENNRSKTLERKKAPEQFTMTLLPFQEEGLFWMCEQEEREDVRGGILADEMGMGKTIQTIALLLTRKFEKPARPLSEYFGGTLIVAPLAALLQWKEEIQRFTKPNSLKALLYHGSCRTALLKDLPLYDVVIVTYATLEADYRKVLNLHKMPCKYCGRMFLPDKLAFHLRYFCGDEATRTARQAMTERKRARATEKAMKTLNIKQETSQYEAPTLTNVYRSILKEAPEEFRTIPWLQHISQKRIKRKMEKGDSLIRSESVKKNDGNSSTSAQGQHDFISSMESLQVAPKDFSTCAFELQHNPDNTSQGTTQHISSRAALLDMGFSEDLVNLYIQTRREDVSVEDGVEWIIKEREQGARCWTLEKASELKQQLGLSVTDIKKKKITELKTLLKQLGCSTFGTKVELVHRLLLLLFPSIGVQGDLEKGTGDSHDNVLDEKGKTYRNIFTRQSRKKNTLKSGKKLTQWKLRSRDVVKGKGSKGKQSSRHLDEVTDMDSYSETSDKTFNSCSLSTSSEESLESIGHLSKKTKGHIKKESCQLTPTEASLDDEVNLSLSPLHTITWNRIVLDEAHRIKGRTTSSAKSVYALQCDGARWCLSGTPLQNRVGELYSLIRFLRLAPFAYYYCQTKGCQCNSLHFRFKDNRYCEQCHHARLSHYSWFNRSIITPIKKFGCRTEGREALKILKHQVLNKVLLRRTKLERSEDVKLPPLIVLIRRDQLIHAERDFYDSLYKKTATQYSTYVQQGTTLHNFAHIFDLLSRLRQAVDHPYLILYGKTSSYTNSDDSTQLNNICWLCHEPIDNDTEARRAQCHHTFHAECIEQYITSAPEASQLGCPKCFRSLSIDPFNSSETEANPPRSSDHSSILSRFNVAEFTSSTKIEALVQELQYVEEKDPHAKSIIFSQYTAMLDLIEFRLKKASIPCVTLIGSLSFQSRSQILHTFVTDPNLRIILMSLKAGGEGLNLQVANNIFLMEPWWNPATEMQNKQVKCGSNPISLFRTTMNSLNVQMTSENVCQAIQRAHRIGQTKPVRAVRFVCENTVEEKMLQLQEKKQLVFDGTIGAMDTAMTKLTHEDLNFLFQN